ncbi:major histocompatibility complex class I-related gene protein-like isoform X2 [Betta splendens]|uniref:Major histocompatibility complex class I-related gene protein-like isoform X2 n=1 Tax=Betta splendens TaxID=158456 RepID=A0A9W2Y4I2_BETSP|nr:major histocompatibility complex class I-related gene protein-like isoform X2 [Betta splendens]
MHKLFLFLAFLHVSSSVKHTFKIAYFTTTGIPHLPQSMSMALVDDTMITYCDSNRKMEVFGAVAKKTVNRYPDLQRLHSVECFENLPKFLKAALDGVMQLFNQTEGVHCLQGIQGSEWNQNTEEISGFLYYGYDGEDFMSMNLKNLTLIPLKQEAVVIKQILDKDIAFIKETEYHVTHTYPELLKTYLNYETEMRTGRPSVSLLQKSPSSPISCFATGFYPNRADMFWRRDGEQTHEDVDHGEILPNPDGTFQMSVHLDLSSVTAQDWIRYECVFQLSGMKDDVITKLDRAVIKTNEGNSMSLIIVIVAVVVLVALVVVIGFIVYRKRNAKRPPCPVHECGVLEQLSPEVQTQQLEPSSERADV